MYLYQAGWEWLGRILYMGSSAVHKADRGVSEARLIGLEC